MSAREGAGLAGPARGGESSAATARPRLPVWLRKNERHHPEVTQLRARLRHYQLHTVCESARCPNLHECFHRGTATFMILGNLCTRSCGFCSVPKARRSMYPLPVDPAEPENVARMARELGLRYVVVTSVNRDDLPDGGAGQFARTIQALRRQLPQARIEVLVPDFAGDLKALQVVLDAGPDVLSHNVETVPRLYPRVRPQANYQQSLALLLHAKQYRPSTVTKSGLMVGLGETPPEVEQVLEDLRRAQVEVVTIGQYLQPARRNLPVAAFIPPSQFDAYRSYGLALGFREVFSGPFVRSSYWAEQVWENL